MRGRLESVADGRIRGWLWDMTNPGAPVRFDLVIGERPVGVFEAADFREDLKLAGIGSGRHGFEIAIDDAWLQPGENLVSVVPAATGRVVGGSLRVLREDATDISKRASKEPSQSGEPERFSGGVEHVDGRIVRGQIVDLADPDRAVRFELAVDEDVVATLVADRPHEGAGAHGFRVALSAGRLPPGPHRLTVRTVPEGIAVGQPLDVTVPADSSAFWPSRAPEPPALAEVAANLSEPEGPIARDAPVAKVAEIVPAPAETPRKASESARTRPPKHAKRDIASAGGLPGAPLVQARAAAAKRLRGRIEGASGGLLRGWAWDPEHPDLRLEPEVYVDDQPIGRVRADLLRQELARGGIGDGQHGFELAIPSGLRDGQTHRVSLRFGGDRELPATHTRDLHFESVPRTIDGHVEGMNGGAFHGWCWDKADPDNHVELEFYAREEPIGVTLANVPREDLKAAGIGDGAHGFRFPIAPAVLDGDDSLVITVKTTKANGGQTLGALSVADFVPAKIRRQPGVKKAPSAASGSLPAVAGAVPTEAPLSIKDTIKEATAAEAKNDRARAQELLKQVLLREPTNFDALFRLARVTLAIGDIAEAKSLAMAAAEIRPGHPKPSLVLARIAEAEGERLLALELWRNVPPGDPAYVERLQKSTRMLVGMERAQEAIAMLKGAVGPRHGERRLRIPLAELLEESGDLAGALELWQGVAELDPEDKKAQAQVRKLQAPRREPPYVTIPTRYRGAMTRADLPAMVLGGADPAAILIACSLGAFLGDHFEAPVLVVTPEDTPFSRAVAGRLADRTRLVAAFNVERGGEIAFLLPDFVTAAVAARAPEANLLLSYTEDGGVPAAGFHAKLDRYMTWLEDRTAGSRTFPPLTPAALVEDDEAPVLFVDGPAERLTLSPDAIVGKLGRGSVRLELTAVELDDDIDALITSISGAATTVTPDPICAQLSELLGVPSVLVSNDAQVLPNLSAVDRVAPEAGVVAKRAAVAAALTRGGAGPIRRSSRNTGAVAS